MVFSSHAEACPFRHISRPTRKASREDALLHERVIFSWWRVRSIDRPGAEAAIAVNRQRCVCGTMWGAGDGSDTSDAADWLQQEKDVSLLKTI